VQAENQSGIARRRSANICKQAGYLIPEDPKVTLRKLSPLQILRASNISAWWKKTGTTRSQRNAEVLELGFITASGCPRPSVFERWGFRSCVTDLESSQVAFDGPVAVVAAHFNAPSLSHEQTMMALRPLSRHPTTA
jgi:hypothetical protein